LLLPDAYYAFSDTFGRANIAEFDKHQVNYFTREAFDFLYPGYGSSYPSTLGAIGMLTEQGGGGGTAIRTNDGYVLTLRQRVFDHYTTSIATIRKSVERKKELLTYMTYAMNPSNSKTKTTAYVLQDETDGFLHDVLTIFKRQGIKYYKATQDFSLRSAYNYRSGKKEEVAVTKGAYIIPTKQPRHLLINSIMTPTLEIEDSVMYDMSTWSVPLAYNLSAYSTEESFSTEMVEVLEVPEISGKILGGNAQYAYVIDWKQRNAPTALALLWNKKYRVRSARKTIQYQDRKLSEGTLVILKGRNLHKASDIDEDMKRIAKEAGVEIIQMATGRMGDEGIDLASADSRPIEKPKVALLVDSPFSAYTCGQIYYLFDQETKLPVERVRVSVLKESAFPKFRTRYGLATLIDYDVLILPGGGNNLEKVFGENEIKLVENWVKEGGVLIATESAINFFTAEKSKLTKVELAEIKKDSSEKANYVKYGERRDFVGKKRIPGAALRGSLDVTNPLAFGLNEDVYTLKFGTFALKPNPGFQTAGYYHKEAGSLLAGGYASPENLEHLAGQAFAGVQPLGNGKVVFLVDNTQYRMFWRGPSRMMQNAVMLLKGM
jgi:hypothetical protein